MQILTNKRRKLLSERLTELGNYTVASLFISQFLAGNSFNIALAITSLIAGILLHIAGLLISR